MYLTTTVMQTPQHHEVNLRILKGLCYQSARLYNASLYNIRQYFFNTREHLTYNMNWRLMKDTEDYSLLISDSAQQTMRIADRDIQSFFKLLALKKRGKYAEKVRLPRYKDKQGYMVCAICGRSVRVQKDGTVNIGLTKEFREKYEYDCRYIKFTIPKHLKGVKEFKEVRIVPQYNAEQFQIEFIYEAKQAPEQVSGNGWLSIDPGVDNLLACTVFSNSSTRQFLIDGRTPKHINCYYNKTMAKLKSERTDQKTLTKRMIRLMNGRRNRINDYFDKTVNLLVRLCLKEGVSHIVIGYNKWQKDGIHLGKVNNQNFTCIPHSLLRAKLKSKCEMHGIEYISQEESYTSKASCLDLDSVPTYKPNDDEIHVFSGKRIHRGLYRSSDGSVLNADINGSVNILRKYFAASNLKWEYHDRVRALVNAPCRRVIPVSQARDFSHG